MREGKIEQDVRDDFASSCSGDGRDTKCKEIQNDNTSVSSHLDDARNKPTCVSVQHTRISSTNARRI
jgi:hypothetical protein